MLFYVFSKHISHLCESSELLDVADGGKTESGKESLPPHLFARRKVREEKANCARQERRGKCQDRKRKQQL